MEKSKLNYFVDVLAGISLFIVAITGIILFLFLPSGVRQGSYQTFLGVIKGAWTAVHNWAGIIFILLGIIHFLLHWKWFVSMTKNIFKKKK